MKSQKSGQVALIILLIMVVVLTIGLSLISSSITDVSISKDEEEGMRAFSAAEAGIEEALKQLNLETWGASPVPVTVGDLSTIVSVTPQTKVISRTVNQNEYTDINLTNAPGDYFKGRIEVSWTPDAAIEIVLYYPDGTISRQAVQSDSGGVTCETSGFAEYPNSFSFNISPSNRAKTMRITALCATIQLTVNTPGGSDNLPTQEYTISSKASIGGQTDTKTSNVEVNRTAPALPPIFDYVLFSKGSLGQ